LLTNKKKRVPFDQEIIVVDNGREMNLGCRLSLSAHGQLVVEKPAPVDISAAATVYSSQLFLRDLHLTASSPIELWLMGFTFLANLEILYLNKTKTKKSLSCEIKLK